MGEESGGCGGDGINEIHRKWESSTVRERNNMNEKVWIGTVAAVSLIAVLAGISRGLKKREKPRLTPQIIRQNKMKIMETVDFGNASIEEVNTKMRFLGL